MAHSKETSSARDVTAQFYDRLSHSYDVLSEHSEHRARVLGESLLDLRSGERVLEVGVGTGNGCTST